MYNTIIIGGGPAGLTAAINAASEGLSVAVLEKGRLGGAIVTSRRIENYPCGLGTEMTGSDFSYNTEQQARQFGVIFFVGPQYRVVEIRKHGGVFRVFTDTDIFESATVILAIGTSHRTLDVHGLTGENVIYDGELRTEYGQRVVVLGGGNSAGQAVEHLLSSGAVVFLITHRDIRESMSSYLVSRIRQSAVDYRIGELSHAIRHVSGLFDIVLQHGTTIREVEQVYVFAGSQPNTVWLDGLVEVDTEGYIKQASVSGMWAVGDVRSGVVRRLSCAVGSGAEVVPLLHEYMKGL